MEYLRDAETDVGKVAIRVPGEGTRTADAEMLQSKLRIGQRRDLGRYLLRRLPSLAAPLQSADCSALLPVATG